MVFIEILRKEGRIEESGTHTGTKERGRSPILKNLKLYQCACPIL